MTWIKRTVYAGLEELVGCDLESFLDVISLKATGTDMLSDIGFKVRGIDDDGRLIIVVEGDDSLCRPEGWKEELKPGDEVFWNDPDEGRCSDVYKIVEITDDDPRVYRLKNAAGSETEAWLGELS